MSDSGGAVEKEISCPYCLGTPEQENDLKRLACNHLACCDCIQDDLDNTRASESFCCPVCRHKDPNLKRARDLPSANIEIAENAQDGGAASGFDDSSSEVGQEGDLEEFKCSSCGEKAFKYCTKCDIALCIRHQANHDNIFRGHEILGREEFTHKRARYQQSNCSAHSDMEATRICTKCFRLACVLCVTGHPDVSICKPRNTRRGINLGSQQASVGSQFGRSSLTSVGPTPHTTAATIRPTTSIFGFAAGSPTNADPTTADQDKNGSGVRSKTKAPVVYPTQSGFTIGSRTPMTPPVTTACNSNTFGIRSVSPCSSLGDGPNFNPESDKHHKYEMLDFLSKQTEASIRNALLEIEPVLEILRTSEKAVLKRLDMVTKNMRAQSAVIDQRLEEQIAILKRGAETSKGQLETHIGEQRMKVEVYLTEIKTMDKELSQLDAETRIKLGCESRINLIKDHKELVDSINCNLSRQLPDMELEELLCHPAVFPGTQNHFKLTKDAQTPLPHLRVM